MKRILITGANSYIGENVERYIGDQEKSWVVDTLDMQDPEWQKNSFVGYDVVFHVAGIAHADVSDVKDEVKQLYYDVNTRLAIETAQKAKSEGVKQFILMSSMIIYGGREYIDANTEPAPTSFYGDSKWQADKGVRELAEEGFDVVVLRPPMIYGKGSKGNYPALARLARKLPIFPMVNNKRSMLYVGNLCEFVRLMIANEESGIYFPQNMEYSNTSEMVQMIAAAHGKHIWLTSLLSPLVTVGKNIPGKIGNLCKKAFGSSYYDMQMSTYEEKYCIYSFEDSIYKTERE